MVKDLSTPCDIPKDYNNGFNREGEKKDGLLSRHLTYSCAMNSSTDFVILQRPRFL